MKLDDLFKAGEYETAGWLGEHGLLHECDCGYKVYDPSAVEQEAQHRYGDKRWKEINTWAGDLANRFGWMFIETSHPQHGIYHCQFCAGSEWSLLMDLEKMAENTAAKKRKVVRQKATPKRRASREKYLVFIDESYTNEYPRLPGGSMALAALIVSERDAKQLEHGLKEICAHAYRGKGPNELKYSRVSKSAGLLARVSAGVGKLISSLPSSAVIAIYVPSEGFLQEQVRVVRAVAHYAGKIPTAAELAQATSKEEIEAAVRKSVHGLAQTLSVAVGNFIGMKDARAEIFFDPRTNKADRQLSDALEDLLPKIPIDIPLIPHDGAIVMPPPSASMKRLGQRVRITTSVASEDLAGLQIADFLAGDIRALFSDIPELLTEATSNDLLVNKRVLFPQAFRPTELSQSTKQKIARYSGKSTLPLYKRKLVHGLISCYALNGQMRNVDIERGMIYDIMD